MTEKEKRYALLIDSDNISSKYVKNIIDELTKYGIVTIKRIYGDWTRTETNSWKEILLKHSIQPMQQFAYTKGKNATDSYMIIDAMDILYTGNVEGFCIVSSDGDFTRLASRLRESGMTVIGMGEEKTPRSFRAACSRFTVLENLIDTDELPISNDLARVIPYYIKYDLYQEDEPNLSLVAKSNFDSLLAEYQNLEYDEESEIEKFFEV